MWTATDIQQGHQIRQGTPLNLYMIGSLIYDTNDDIFPGLIKHYLMIKIWEL